MIKEKFDLSLILACYNEGEIFEHNVEQIFSILDQTDFSYELIFIDDASQDSTSKKIQKIISQHSRRSLQAYYHQYNLGRGKTVSEGIRFARGKVVGFIDIDLEVPADYLPRFVNSIMNGYEVACGLRIYDFTWRSLPRWFASKGYTWLRQKMLRISLKDTEAGYKFFNRQKILPILNRTKDAGWFWDTEIMIYSSQAGLKIIEIPTVFIRNFNKKSTVKLIPDSIDYFIKLIKLSNKLSKRK